MTDPDVVVSGPDGARRAWARILLAAGFVAAVLGTIAAGLAALGSSPAGADSTTALQDPPAAVLAAVSGPGQNLDTTVTLRYGSLVVRPPGPGSVTVDMANAESRAAADTGHGAPVVCRRGLLSTTYMVYPASSGYLDAPVWMCVQVIPGSGLPAGLGRPARPGAIDFVDAQTGVIVFEFSYAG